MNNRISVLLLGIASLGLILSGCDDNKTEATATQQTAPPPIVNVMPVSFQSVPLQTKFAGRTVAFQEAQVRPQATGVIKEILYQEGRIVKEGQSLYRLSIDNYESATIANQAAVNQATANVSTAQASYNTAVANRASQVALLEQAKSDLNRLTPLIKINAISQQQYDQAITKFKTAQAALASTEASIAQAEANIQSANAAVDSAKAQLNASKIEYNRTTVTAPITGVTDRSNVTVGALVNANQAEPLVTITRLDPIYVEFNLSSSELLNIKTKQANGAIKPGDTQVKVVLEDGTIYPFAGQLSLAEAKVDQATGSITWRATFPNNQYTLMPGMFVNAQITLGYIDNAVLIPQSALMRTPKGEAQVYIVDNDNKIQVRPVTVEGTYQSSWVVTDGLLSGDKVVMVGGSRVRPNVVVNPQPYQATAQASANENSSHINPDSSPSNNPNKSPNTSSSADRSSIASPKEPTSTQINSADSKQ